MVPVKNKNRKRAVGFYRDHRGRTRPITDSAGKAESKKKIVPSRKFVAVKPKTEAGADHKLVQTLENTNWEDTLARLASLKNELSSLEEQKKRVDAKTPEVGKLEQRKNLLKREIDRNLSLIHKLGT
jgi:hypothetical protein